MSGRGSSYNRDEDAHLCRIYLEISQDPITGRNQSSEQFWVRIMDMYNETKLESWVARNKRSLESRMQAISAEVKKLNGCVRQIENMHPSGASESDILNRAKTLMMQDLKYKKGFRFDHVWDMVKDFEKFKDGLNITRRGTHNESVHFDSSQSDNPTPNSPGTASPALSSFSLHLDDDNNGGTSSQRPIGVKKAKLKRKNEEEVATIINSIKKDNQDLLEMLKSTRSERQQQLDLIAKNLALKEAKREDKILFQDLNSIVDPIIREHIRAEQVRILQKRAEQQQEPPSTSTTFEKYFSNIGDLALTYLNIRSLL